MDVSLLSLIVVAVGGFITVWLRPVVLRRIQSANEIRYLHEEFKDIARHLTLNLSVIENICKQKHRLPILMHLEKLKIPTDSAIFSIDTLRLANPRIASRLYEMRLKMRNLNIEIDQLISLADSGQIDAFYEVLEYHRQKSHGAIEVLDNERKVLKSSRSDSKQKSLVLPAIIAKPGTINSLNTDKVRGEGGISSKPTEESEPDAHPITPPTLNSTRSKEKLAPEEDRKE